MEIGIRPSLEKSLIKTEADVEETIKAANTAISVLKKLRAAVKTGNLRDLRKTFGISEQAISILQQQIINTKEGWDFNEETYLSGRDFISEIIKVGEQIGVNMFEQDNKLYCYPFIIRIIPNELSVQINKVKEKRLRPTVFVKQLKELQNKPIRFNPQNFLDCLWEVYAWAVASQGDDPSKSGAIIKLFNIYRMLTLLPGQSKEYSLQEFVRDIYLLDKSRILRTKDGMIVNFPASTGTKSAKDNIMVITQDGHEKKYYGISFSKG